MEAFKRKSNTSSINILYDRKYPKFSKKYNKIQLSVSQRAWTGFVDYDIDAGPVKEFYEVDIETLKAPMWRFGKEWRNPKDPWEDDDGQE